MNEISKIQAERGKLKQMAVEMRKNATPAEERAWDLLRGRRFMGRKFRRQHVVEGKIVDFYCHELRLCVELDRQPHLETEGQIRDLARDEELRVKGYKIVRFMNEELFRNPGTFRERLSQHCKAPPL